MSEQNFDKHEWNAPVYETPEQMLRAFNLLLICGKRIRRIDAIGMAEHIGEYRIPLNVPSMRDAQFLLKKTNDAWKHSLTEQKMVDCDVAICEPLVFTFEDGSTFELRPVNWNSIKMSTNQIASGLTEGTNRSNFDASALFRSLIGCSITRMSVRITTLESQNSDSSRKEVEKSIAFLFWTDGDDGFSISQRYEGWYKFTLWQHHHISNNGISKGNIHFDEFLRGIKQVRQIPIVEGHHTASYFWIMPVRQLDSREEGHHGIEEYRPEEISIEENDVYEFLSYFLIKYFDSHFPYKHRGESGPPFEFEWYLEYNIYTYDTVRSIITEIRRVAELLLIDFDDPDLADIKNRFEPYTFGFQNFNRKLSQTGKNEYIKRNVYIATDFYERFCRRMEAMMKYTPQYDLISFMGP